MIAVGRGPSRQCRRAPRRTCSPARPRSYGDVPRLGPPLPGDLGRPILERQREMATETPAAGPGPAPGDGRRRAGRGSRAAAAARRGAPGARGAGDDAARRAPRRPTPASGAAALAAGPAAPAPAEADGAAGAAGAGAESRLRARPRSRATASIRTGFRRRPRAGSCSAGSVIAASLLTGLNSDLPGMVVAQVTQNVYDSATGRTLLIPQGARLIGRYDSVVAFGQSRALLVWQRIVLPDGSSIALDNVPATDARGYAGRRGPGRLPHLAAAARDRPLDPARRRHAADASATTRPTSSGRSGNRRRAMPTAPASASSSATSTSSRRSGSGPAFRCGSSSTRISSCGRGGDEGRMLKLAPHSGPHAGQADDPRLARAQRGAGRLCRSLSRRPMARTSPWPSWSRPCWRPFSKAIASSSGRGRPGLQGKPDESGILAMRAVELLPVRRRGSNGRGRRREQQSCHARSQKGSRELKDDE